MITGRPKKELNFSVFEKLCAICATEEEIADWFDMCVDTLSTRCQENYDMTFSEVYKKFSGEGKISLRRKQLQVAMDGSVPMLIWLGKQLLGQKDSAMVNNTILNRNSQICKDGSFPGFPGEDKEFVERLKKSCFPEGLPDV